MRHSPLLPPATRRGSLHLGMGLLAGAAGWALGAGHPAHAQPAPSAATPVLALPVEGTLPPLGTGGTWINSPPLSTGSLRGKVVLVDFWTYSCINCLNALPHVLEWHRKYSDQGLVVLGVHTPEFAYEKDIGNVRGAVQRLGIGFPVLTDNNFALWRAFANNYWPALYFVDAQGQVRHHHFGEGEYDRSDRVIRQLLDDARGRARPA